MKMGSPLMQQSLARVLGVIDYDSHPASLSVAVTCLLDGVRSAKSTVEVRRSCYLSLPLILANAMPHLTTHLKSDGVNLIVNTLLAGLNDYTIDERGDVGSWVRIASIRGLTAVSELMLTNSSSIPDFEHYFPSEIYHAIVGGMLKQGVERLDNVRQEAGGCFIRLLRLPLPSVTDQEKWSLPSLQLLQELFETNGSGSSSWSDGAWLFPRAIRLLGVPEYRQDILSGILLSLSSKTDSTQRPIAKSLVDYVEALPLSSDSTTSFSLLDFVDDLIERVKPNLSSNTIVIPVLQTFNVLLEADSLRRLSNEPRGIESLQTLLSISSRNVSRFKSIQRIHESMKIIINLLTFETLFAKNVAILSEFLSHSFPRIRADAAEYLYLTIQGADLEIDTDEVENIILDTEWSSSDLSVAKDATERILRLFQSGGGAG